MNTSISSDELWHRWKDLEACKPANPKRKPTELELKALRLHKQQEKDFLAKVPPEHASWLELKRKPRPTIKTKKTASDCRAPPKPPKIILLPRTEPVSLGWRPETFTFAHVIPFLSHLRRSRYEEDQDQSVLGGIDRRVFSNLYVDTKPLRITHPNTLLGYGSAYPQALCAESYYMAAKVYHAWDARFIMEEISSSQDVASFGHGGLQLTAIQRERLTQLGAPSDGFKLVSPEGEEPRWLRGQDGKVPVREGWYEIRHNVFLYILRHKFSPKAPAGSAARSTMEALIGMIQGRGELPLMVEHRRKDSFWGDGLTGEGSNVLGRVLTQIVLERAGLSDLAAMLPWSEVGVRLGRPNSDLVQYV